LPDIHPPSALVTYLDDAGVTYAFVDPGVPMPTVPLAAAAIGVPPERIIKSLVWQAADGALAVVIASGPSKVDRKQIAAVTGRPGWKMAPPDVALAATGFATGGTPPVGPGYGVRFAVLVDRAVFAQAVVYGGGGHEALLLRLAPAEIQRLTHAEIHDLST
jgi:prolyl-tRNA editing enzyme YbaK/EbsC (Cys-tRNA(Pro) deacylase)